MSDQVRCGGGAIGGDPAQPRGLKTGLRTAYAPRRDQEKKEIAAKSAAEKAAFEALSPADHLASAKMSLADGDLDLADRHLDVIPKDAKEAKSAAQVSRQVDRARDKITKEAEQAFEARKLAERKAAADIFDHNLIERRVEATVKLTGKNKTVLHVEYALCGRVILHDMMKIATDQHWDALGFKRIECVDAGDTTYWQDL